MISLPPEHPSTLALRLVTLLFFHLIVARIFPTLSTLPWMTQWTDLSHHLQPRLLANAKAVTMNSTGVELIQLMACIIVQWKLRVNATFLQRF